MPTEVDGAGRHVDIHQVIDCAALYMVLNPVHQVPTANIEDFDVGQGPVDVEWERVRLEALAVRVRLLGEFCAAHSLRNKLTEFYTTE